MKLVRVSVHWACFGFEVDERGTVRASAPIGKWMLGKSGEEMISYWKKKGAEIHVQAVPAMFPPNR